ncbi:MAG: hypothetical protein A3H98_01110 [Bacteroidetes bacterium RIFCSPLOWO2_02_FULL_36_8]|nr:MAG: hypothetical protein A3H98_01110 [Bacteroidetes bacterium RIFCSPLOWO2_02_FULL_36_8]OFY68862.1 MAG: hypothetical protein A3G23_03490 [Bacteroidetes bacterium RIFCSPLOWO2_12_FULL_37_12]
MKTIKNFKLMSLCGALIFMSLFIISSCTNECPVPGNGGTSTTVTDDKTVMDKAQRALNRINKIKIVDTGNKKVLGTANLRDGGFSFAEPNEGFNFSSSEGVEFVESPNGGGILYVSANAFGSVSGGGTVIAGKTSLNINYTFCFSASDEAMGLNMFGSDSMFSGVSVVLGISGDFKKLLEGNTSAGDTSSGDSSAKENPFEFFNGMAVYIVYAERASGSYDVLNWAESAQDMENNTDKLADKGLSVVVDFRAPAFSLSSKGKLNVSGGNIGFNGEYLQFSFESGQGLDDIDEDVKFKKVAGFGSMGCSN